MLQFSDGFRRFTIVPTMYQPFQLLSRTHSPQTSTSAILLEKSETIKTPERPDRDEPVHAPLGPAKLAAKEISDRRCRSNVLFLMVVQCMYAAWRVKSLGIHVSTGATLWRWFACVAKISHYIVLRSVFFQSYFSSSGSPFTSTLYNNKIMQCKVAMGSIEHNMSTECINTWC